MVPSHFLFFYFVYIVEDYAARQVIFALFAKVFLLRFKVFL